MADQENSKGVKHCLDKQSPDLHTQQRLLKFINEARVINDLTVLPHDVPVVDEELV